MKTNPTEMLVIGIDAAQPSLVRSLIDRGQMPALGKLLSQGKWRRVASAASIGSGAVWPTFITGVEPQVHGVYGEWLWHPETMDISRYRGSNLNPFWKGLEEQGISVGVLDVPFMPMIGISNGFEISEWGPHDVLECKTQVGPDTVASIVSEQARHPLSFGTAVTGPDDYQNLEKLGQACLEGIKLRGTLAKELLRRMRPRLSLVAFTEIHRSSHYLWNTVEPEHEIYRRNGFAGLQTIKPNLEDIYRALDLQIGEILEVVGEETPVMVFSLHGMRPTHGTPAFLTPLLCEREFARIADWETQDWKDRSRALFAKTKRLMPGWLKKLYYGIAPRATTHLVARSTMLPLYDWSTTKAFSLPTDQHGWVRINLIGRESKGIVPPERYVETCEELETLIRGLVSEDGAPLALNVIRTSQSVEDALDRLLPDLVVHWADAAFSPALRIRGTAVKAEFVGEKYVGQHALEGFCILRGAFQVADEEMLPSKDMHKLALNLLLKKEPDSTRQPLENKQQAAGSLA